MYLPDVFRESDLETLYQIIQACAEAYVSAGFYPSKIDNPSVVATWNYVSVQAQGVPSGGIPL